MGKALAKKAGVAAIETTDEIERFTAELIDRFGALPPEVMHLLHIVAIKQLCRAAQIEKVEAGPKGATISFRNNEFSNPGELVRLIREDAKRAGMNKLTKREIDAEVFVNQLVPHPRDLAPRDRIVVCLCFR